jgi:DNA invertase Pin-like site-specific DNA recombinase
MKGRRKRAFSYIRFSDRKQAKGGSKRRQLEWGVALCAGKGWQLDQHFRLQDEGVSAFRGTNATAGKLAAFLEAIKAGDVKPGDVLLIESLDRLSREDIDPAWELFRKILKSGVEVYTREPERHYAPADLNNFGTRIEVQAYMLRAYNESATKSMRGLDYWKNRRDGLARKPRPIHQVTPAWLRLSADRKRFDVIREAAEAIRLIYRWAGEGLGLDSVTKRLNEQKVPPIGNNIRRNVFKKGWCRSYVAKLLADKAVVGEFQPHAMKMVPDPERPDGPGKWKRVPHGDPIPNYFPEVIPEKEWYRVRHAVKERGRASVH